MNTEYLVRHEFPMPAGKAHITTYRPAPDSDWITLVESPGLDCDGISHVSSTDTAARRMHYAYLDIVEDVIARIPTIDFRRPDIDTYDPDDRLPAAGYPHWQENP